VEHFYFVTYYFPPSPVFARNIFTGRKAVIIVPHLSRKATPDVELRGWVSRRSRPANGLSREFFQRPRAATLAGFLLPNQNFDVILKL
jgi:hypothetical protein